MILKKDLQDITMVNAEDTHQQGCLLNLYFPRRSFDTREEALACEQQIKGWSRNKKEALIRGDWEEISRLARKHHTSTGSV
jgi:predicted GIY-YIG superfamily endonuclease